MPAAVAPQSSALFNLVRAKLTVPQESAGGTSNGGKRCFDGHQQICVTEWLEQKPSRALFEHSSTNGLISLTCDEYDGDLLPAML